MYVDLCVFLGRALYKENLPEFLCIIISSRKALKSSDLCFGTSKFIKMAVVMVGNETNNLEDWI